MSNDILNILSHNIEEAFKTKNVYVLEKETTFIILSIFQTFMDKFNDQIRYIKSDLMTCSLNHEYLLSPGHLTHLRNWIHYLKSMDTMETFNFGKLKLDLEEWYYNIGGTNLIVKYCESYLLDISEVTKILNISKSTLHTYIEVGFECIDTKKFPKCTVELWKNPSYMLKMQRLFQNKQMRELTVADHYKKISQEIADLELSYGGTFNEIFYQYNGDDMEDWNLANDYRTWRDLLYEKAQLISSTENPFSER